MNLATQILDALRQDDFEPIITQLQIPILIACQGIEQNQYHNETVYEHLMLTAKALPADRPLLRLCGLFHDVGKPITKAGTGDICTFYNHEVKGARIAYEYMISVGFHYTDCQYVSRLVRHHMFRFEDVTKYKTIKKWYKNNKDIFEDLFLLRQADRAGNMIKKDRPRITSKMEELRQIIQLIEQEPEPIILAISGDDLIRMNYQPGPLFRHVLGTLRKRVENEELPNDREVLLTEMAILLQENH